MLNIARTVHVKKKLSIIFFKIETNTKKKLKYLLLHQPGESLLSTRWDLSFGGLSSGPWWYLAGGGQVREEASCGQWFLPEAGKLREGAGPVSWG